MAAPPWPRPAHRTMVWAHDARRAPDRVPDPLTAAALPRVFAAVVAIPGGAVAAGFLLLGFAASPAGG